MTDLKQLVVSVDTEEEGLWGGQYQVRGNTTENLRGLPRFQAVCEQLGVPPTYLIDAPVLDDAAAISHLRRWQDAGQCEVGSHCHPWCNPPFDPGPLRSVDTFLCNLPIDLQREKLRWLTERIADAVGRSPTSYRAGRYGFDSSSAELLLELGYRVDSSVLPMYDYSGQGGPDYRLCRRQPHHLGSVDAEQTLIEIPITAGFTAAGYSRRRAIWSRLRQRPWNRFHGAGIADRLGIARRVKLSPEGSRLTDLIALVDASVQDGLKTLVLMLHSSSLVAGLSPYARDQAMLDKLYDRLTGVVQYATSEFGFQGTTLTGAANSMLAPFHEYSHEHDAD